MRKQNLKTLKKINQREIYAYEMKIYVKNIGNWIKRDTKCKEFEFKI